MAADRRREHGGGPMNATRPGKPSSSVSTTNPTSWRVWPCTCAAATRCCSRTVARRRCRSWAERPDVAVVISDMRMPAWTGRPSSPMRSERHADTVRILLDRPREMDAAISAVNDGQIFRFLTKPCPPPTVLATVADAIEQNRLIRAERELLEVHPAGQHQGTRRTCWRSPAPGHSAAPARQGPHEHARPRRRDHRDLARRGWRPCCRRSARSPCRTRRSTSSSRRRTDRGGTPGRRPSPDGRGTLLGDIRVWRRSLDPRPRRGSPAPWVTSTSTTRSPWVPSRSASRPRSTCSRARASPAPSAPTSCTSPRRPVRPTLLATLGRLLKDETGNFETKEIPLAAIDVGMVLTRT